MTGCGVDIGASTFLAMLRAPDAGLEGRLRADNVGVPLDLEDSYGYTANHG